MKEPIRLGIILFLITSVCVGLSGLVYEGTKTRIANQNEITKQEAMKAIIQEADTFIPAQDVDTTKVQEVYMAKKNNENIGFVIKVAKEGYGGPVELMVGVDKELTIIGVQILSHSETPGLGANVTKETFLTQFSQKKAPIKVVKGEAQGNDIAAITGATITSTAVTNGINEALNYMQEHQQAIMNGGQ